MVMTARIPDADVIRMFPRYPGPGTPGFVTDFLGTKTRNSILFAAHAGLSGAVEDYPIPMNFHATAIEWAGALRAVLEAKGAIVAMELGAGWGPWLVVIARAAQSRGVDQVRLVGVEGSKEHCQFMRQHFQDNNLHPDEHALIHGVVGTSDGLARFPVAENPAEDYGSAPTFTAASALKQQVRGLLGRLRRRLFARSPAPSPLLQRMEEVPCYSLASLIRPYACVDIIHVDIQGAEHVVIASGRNILMKSVKRLVIGTHGRAIEELLFGELGTQGWILEAEESCLVHQQANGVALFRDGCQVWRNPKLTYGAAASPSRAA